MKRRFITICVFLLLLLSAGAIVNVAVAWGCVLCEKAPVHAFLSSHGGDPGALVKGVPADWQPQSRRHQRVRWYGEWQFAFGIHAFYGIAIENDDRGTLETSAGTVYFFVHSVHGRLTGWPCLSLSGSIKDTFTGYPSSRPARWDAWQTHYDREWLPMRPLWPGFAINTVFYAAVMWVLFVFPFVLRRRIRARRGLCPACAYPIGTSEVCTECGTKLGTKALATASKLRHAPEGTKEQT